MSRTARSKTLIIAAVTLLAAGTTGGVWYRQSHDKSAAPVASQSATVQVPTTHITYPGQDGKTALELLKTKAQVQTKSSSVGEYVSAINGNDGGGSKYWIFYINGKESTEGAGTYVTHSTETIEWKLQ